MAKNRELENHTFGDLIDVDEVQGMMNLFHELTGAPVGIIDVDNTILVAVGWQGICTRFHRVHPETREKCFESDARIARHLKEGEFVEYKCKNGLWDLAYPIIIEGRHMATIFLGQFFYESKEIDRDFFVKQAEKYGFDKKEYLRALDRAPVFSKEFVKKVLDWDAKLARLLARQGLANLRLKKEIAERRRAEAELEKHRDGLEELVRERTVQLTMTNEQLQEEIIERGRAEEALQRRTHDLDERIKELNCLFGIGHIVEKPGVSLERIMRGAVELVSASWQYPEIACGRITLNGQEFKTDNFAETHWKMTSEIIANNEPVGNLEVRYLAEKPERDEGPFMEEERGLIDAVAERLGKIIERKRAETALVTANARMSTLLKTIPAFAYIKDAELNYVAVNEPLAEMVGVAPEEMVGRCDLDFFPKEQAEAYRADDANVIASGQPLVDRVEPVRGGNDRSFWVLTKKLPILDDDGRPAGLVGLTMDITSRKRSEEALSDSERSYRTLAENMPGIVYRVLDRESGGMIFFNDVVVKMTGYRPGELREGEVCSIEPYIHPGDRDQVVTEVKRAITGKAAFEVGYRFIHKDGGVRHFLERGKPIFDADGALLSIDGMIFDITERKRMEERVKASLREKEVLLQEIHHRVKNNLAIVSSLLGFQAETSRDERVRVAFRESRGRIRTMARIHEHLYRSTGLARIDMAEYIREVAVHLVRSYGVNHITLRMDVADVELDMERAMPCGLIVNELVSNALKHAFPPGRRSSGKQPCKIRVGLRMDDDGRCMLTVSDNGVGLPAGFQIERVGDASLGLRLVNLLSRQLEGDLRVDGEGGAAFCLTFVISKEGSDHDSE
ncbi:MAG: PAS domain S-box protein [Desulfobacterales bacterium]|nr:PAS domain S-box protein [Desulfobacterales bacterium]